MEDEAEPLVEYKFVAIRCGLVVAGPQIVRDSVLWLPLRQSSLHNGLRLRSAGTGGSSIVWRQPRGGEG